MATADSGHRNIVLCSDGTGQRGGPGRQSNVYRTYLAVDTNPEGGPWQIRFHDDGVGSQDFAVLKIIGGAVGFGISRNIRELYAGLITSYQRGDRIYLFGFSRGAYTVRVLANLICLFGIPNRENKSPRQILDMAQSALDVYKAANIKSSKSSDVVDHYRKAYGNVLESRAQDKPFDIHFVGCWDTVGAIGLPFDELTKAVMKLFPLSFQNNCPPKGVHHLCQALAIDEERRTFHPELWEETNLAPNQTLEQVWFPGVHSNVGGSYPKDQLALECLRWMVGQAKLRGLKFNEHVLQTFTDLASPHGKMYDSRAGLAAYYRYRPRRIDQPHTGISRPKIHASALDRIGYRSVAYAPTAITADEFETVETIESIENGRITRAKSDLKPPFPESDQQKEHRVAQLEQAHDYVVLNWIGYYMFILWTVYFVVFGFRHASDTSVAPLIKVPDADGTELWRAFLKGIYSLEYQLLETLSAVLPGFVTSIVRGLQNVPGMFLLLSFLLVVMLYLSRRVVGLKRDAAARAWQPHDQMSASESVSSARVNLFARIRRTLVGSLDVVTIALLRLAGKIAGWFRRTSLAFWLANCWRKHIAAVVGFAIILCGIVLGTFAGTRYAWNNYHRTELGTYQLGQVRELPASVLAIGEVRKVDPVFDSANPYFPTGVFAVQGQHYQVTVEKASTWDDLSLPASPDGLTNEADEKLVHRLLRRSRQAKVFTLMAAVGPDAGRPIAVGRSEEFTAVVSGPLYLFVNDVPGFYHNNKGTASVNITRIPELSNAAE